MSLDLPALSGGAFAVVAVAFGLASIDATCTPQPQPPVVDASFDGAPPPPPPPPPVVDATPPPVVDATPPPPVVDAAPPVVDAAPPPPPLPCTPACAVLKTIGCPLGSKVDCAAVLTRDLGSGKVRNKATGHPLSCGDVQGFRTKADALGAGFTCQ
jgi:hypothetical protein